MNSGPKLFCPLVGKWKSLPDTVKVLRYYLLHLSTCGRFALSSLRFSHVGQNSSCTETEILDSTSKEDNVQAYRTWIAQFSIGVSNCTHDLDSVAHLLSVFGDHIYAFCSWSGLQHLRPCVLPTCLKVQRLGGDHSIQAWGITLRTPDSNVCDSVQPAICCRDDS